MRVVSLLLLLLVSTGCGLFEAEEGTVEVRLRPNALLISNETGKTIHYEVFDGEILALINWVPCTDVNIPDGRVAAIRFDEVWNYESGHDVVVYWWFRPRTGGCAEEINSIVVEIE